MKVITEVGLLARVGMFCLIAGLVLGFALACSVFGDDRATSGPVLNRPAAQLSERI